MLPSLTDLDHHQVMSFVAIKFTVYNQAKNWMQSLYPYPDSSTPQSREVGFCSGTCLKREEHDRARMGFEPSTIPAGQTGGVIVLESKHIKIDKI